MCLKNFFALAFVLFPVIMFAQVKQGTSLIDSMVKQLPKVPDSKVDKAVLLGNIGIAYNEQDNSSKALEYYFKALKIFDKLGNENGLARINGNIGSAYLSMAIDTTTEGKLSKEAKTVNLHKAVDYLNRSIAISKDNGYLDVMNTFYKDLSEALRLLNYNEALANAKQNDTKDAEVNNDNQVKIANIATRRDEELKNKQAEIDRIQSANKDREQWYYIIGIGILVVVFGSMFWTYRKQKANTIIISEEKKKAEDLLLNILPEQVADELKEKGMVHAQQYDNVTVIITDFVSFTSVAERFSPKQLVGELHACFKAFDGMLDKYHIEKIKTVGDAYLAVAGVPVSNPLHANNAVAVAIMMRDFMLYRKTQLGDATFDMRIGVHTGSVVAGIVGVKKFAYDIWGDTVNLAARMEQNGEPGKVNISQSTYDLVKDKFHCEYRGEIVARIRGN
jgi:adenylate cyclase